MKKGIKIIIAVSLVLIIAGSICCVAALSGVDYDIKKLSTHEPPVKLMKDYDALGIKTVDIRTGVSDIMLYPSVDGRIHIRYFASYDLGFDIVNENGVLSIRESERVCPWYEHLTVSFGGDRTLLAVELPVGFNGSVKAVSQADADINGLDIGGALTVSTCEDITVNSIKTAGLYLDSTDGSISCADMLIEGNADILTACADVTLGSVTCTDTFSCTVEDAEITQTGLLKAASISIATESVKGIRLGTLDAQKTAIKSKFAPVSGTSVGKASDYSKQFIDSRLNDYEGTTPGSRVLSITCQEGGIFWNFSEE